MGLIGDGEEDVQDDLEKDDCKTGGAQVKESETFSLQPL
jgi:hypothetical protein